jgi:histidinol phosphatase-like PHP family hydrolase
MTNSALPLLEDYVEKLERAERVLHAMVLTEDPLKIAELNHRVIKRAYLSAAQIKQRNKRRSRENKVAFRLRIEQEKVWEAGLKQVSDAWFAEVERNIEATYWYARSRWKEVSAARKLWHRIRRDLPPDPPPNPKPPNPKPSPPPKRQKPPARPLVYPTPIPPDHTGVNQELMNQINNALWAQQGVQMYLQLAQDTSHLAGQSSLNHMGLNKTFAWAHPRAMAQDMFAVRGSKVITQMYDNHMNRLTQIITRATDPRNPKTIQEVKAEIKREWPRLQAYQVERIARTETAAVWTQTAANAYSANGVTNYESIIAQGPSVGIESEMPCDMCIEASFDVHSMDDDLPPWHPNCRCEAVPVLENADGSEWLGPDEPWTGGDMEVVDPPDMQLENVLPTQLVSVREPVPAPREVTQENIRELKSGIPEGTSQANSYMYDAFNLDGASRYAIRDAQGITRGGMAYEVGPNSVIVQYIGSTLRGGGTEMLRIAARTAKELGLPIRLAPVKESIGFYEKLGFRHQEEDLMILEGEPLDRLASRVGEADHAPHPMPTTDVLPEPPAVTVTTYTQTEVQAMSTDNLWRAMSRNGHAENLAREDVALQQDRLIADELWARGDRALPPGSVRYSDLIGESHFHTPYSDGHNTLQEMAESARLHGQKEILVSEHANLMSEADFTAQRSEIDALNADYAARGIDFKVLQGVEVNILKDGSLDLTDVQLARFDRVNAGMHIDRDINATDRYLKAMDSNFVSAIAHPHTGGDYVNWDALAQKAADRKIALEVNGRDILRRDTDVAAAKMIQSAKRYGAKLQFGADAHNDANLVDSLYAVRFAAKRGVTAEDIVPFQRRLVDDVSIPGEKPISKETLAIIKDRHLDESMVDLPQPGSRAASLLGKNKDTREMYTQGGRYLPERKPYHDQYIDQELAKGVTEEHPIALVMAGGPAAGKSVALRASPDLIPERAVMVNPDVAMQILPEYAILDGDMYKAAALHEEGADMSARLFQAAMKKHTNLVLDGVGNSGPGKFLNKLELLKKNGYEVRVVMADAPTNVAIERNIDRAITVGSPDFNRFVPVRVQKQLYRDAVKRMDEWMGSNAVDTFKVIRTSGAWGDTAVTNVVEGGKGEFKILDREGWNTIQAKKDLRDAEIPDGSRTPLPSAASTPEQRLADDSRDWIKSLTPREQDALRMYSETDYENINGLLRTGAIDNAAGLEHTQKQITELETALNKTKLTENITTWRGIMEPDKTLGDMSKLVGREFTDKGFMSTTTAGRSMLEGFDYEGSAIFELHIPTGYNAGLLSDMRVSQLPHEKELLLQRDSTIRITKVEIDKTTGAWVVQADVLPKPIPEHVIPGGIEDLKAELYSTRNKISGLNTRLKRLEPGDARRADVQQKLDALTTRRDELQTQIRTGAVEPPPEVRLPEIKPPEVVKPEVVKTPEIVKPEVVKPPGKVLLTPEIKAQITSANNRISGLKTRIKRLDKVGGDTNELRTRLDNEISTRDALKQGRVPPEVAPPLPPPKARAVITQEDLVPGYSKNIYAGLREELSPYPDNELVKVPQHSTDRGYKTNDDVYVYRYKGTLVRLENDPSIYKTPVTAQDRVNKMLDDLPKGNRSDRLKMVNVFLGASPDDAYFQKAYTNFSASVAQASHDGEMTFWNGGASIRDVIYDHEYGHIVGQDGGPLVLKEWVAAQKADKKSMEAYFGKKPPGEIGSSHEVKISQTSVTAYGGNSTNEDWAESVMLYLKSRKSGGLRVGPRRRTFDDLFPARAKLIREWLYGVPKSVTKTTQEMKVEKLRRRAGLR